MRAVISRHVHAPFSWGTSDCAFVFDAIEAMTGRDVFEPLRGYSSEIGAIKALRSAGYKSVLEFIEASFQEIDPALAGRGDLGYPASVAHPLMSPAIIDGAYAYSKQPAGAVVIPRTAIARAWRV